MGPPDLPRPTWEKHRCFIGLNGAVSLSAGLALGAIDNYILAPRYRKSLRDLSPKDIKVRIPKSPGPGGRRAKGPHATRCCSCIPPPPPPRLYKPRPCPRYNRRRDRNNCVRNLIMYEM